MKKVIVSGAAGFLGKALCDKLNSRGINVIALVRTMSENALELKKSCRVIVCDSADYLSLPELIEDRDIDAFYYFAWNGSAGELRADANVQLDNIRAVCDAIKACKAMDCDTFIFASSIMEYEIMAAMETEATPSINTLYSSAKLAADYFARTLAGSLNISFIKAVISNIYGPGEKSARLINTSIRKMLNGEHCSFSEGKQLYDFIYIDDAVEAFYLLGVKGVNNRAYYIGSMEVQPLRNYLLRLRDTIDPNIEIGLGELPFNGVSLTYKEFDIFAIQKDTDFSPSVSFEEGIRRTRDYIISNT